jgi:hypothetical protein
MSNECKTLLGHSSRQTWKTGEIKGFASGKAPRPVALARYSGYLASIVLRFILGLGMTCLLITDSLSEPCSDTLSRIALDQVLPTQWGLRPGSEFSVEAVAHYLLTRGKMPLPIGLIRTEDGQYFVKNGHRRFQAAQRARASQPARWTFLDRDEGDFQVEHLSRASLQEVDLIRGWISPMRLGTDLRRSELGGWEKLIERLKFRMSAAELEAFIRRHPEAYLYRSPQNGIVVNQGTGLGHQDLETFLNYMRSMDSTVQIKTGQLAPGFPSDGTILELGYGTGAQAYLHALLHPDLLVVGMDLSPEMQAHAAATYQLPNLVFLVGDALSPDFPVEFFDAVVESSFTHEVFSYGNPIWSSLRVKQLREKSTALLKPMGSHAMRDFGRSPWPEKMHLDLPTSSRDLEGDLGKLSLSDLFLKYIEEVQKFYREKTGQELDVGVREFEASRHGVRTFEVNSLWAHNFLLRLMYVKNRSFWEELPENYPYESIEEAVELAESLGLRVDFSGLIYNPFHLLNWWEGQGVSVRYEDGSSASWPPSNRLLFATRPLPHEPKAFRVRSLREVSARPEFLRFESYLQGDSGPILDLARVPGRTHTFIPFEIINRGSSGGERTSSQAKEVFIWLRRGVEAPNQLVYQKSSRLIRDPKSKKLTIWYGGLTSAALSVLSNESSVSASQRFIQFLRDRLGRILPKDFQFGEVIDSKPFLTAPGGADEVVDLHLLDVSGKAKTVFQLLEQDMKAYRIDHLLAAAHVGMISDPRAEVAAYELALREHLILPAWLGGDPDFSPGAVAFHATLEDLRGTLLHSQRNEQLFKETNEAHSHFLSVMEATIQRIYPSLPTSENRIELVQPKNLSIDTFSVGTYAVDPKGEVWVALERRAFPAMELRGFGSSVFVTPAWRIGKDIDSELSARDFVQHRLVQDFGAKVEKIQALGHGYFPSSRFSAEKVSPYAARVKWSEKTKDLFPYRLRDLLQLAPELPDLHSRIMIYRLAHAAGLFEK